MRSGPSPAELDRIRNWTPIDEDLTEVDEELREIFRAARIDFGYGDLPRSERWAPVEGVEALLDIPYLDDGRREHLLDVYLPSEAVLRGGASLPVFIDIHGGGFTYGYKELNRNFCEHLASKGFAVFSINYRLAPTATFMQQLEDVCAAYGWIAEHLSDFPVDPNSVFVTGDSAGGTLGFYSTALTLNPRFAEAAGIPRAELSIRGAAFVSGLYDLGPLLGEDPFSPAPYLNRIAHDFFDQRFRSLEPRFREFGEMVEHLVLPPMYLCTSSDDFLEADSLDLAARLVRAGKRVEIEDWAPEPGVTLGHVFPVCLSWLEESDRVLERMRRFAYRLL